MCGSIVEKCRYSVARGLSWVEVQGLVDILVSDTGDCLYSSCSAHLRLWGELAFVVFPNWLAYGELDWLAPCYARQTHWLQTNNVL